MQKVRSEIKLLARELTSPLATSRSALVMLLAGDLGELGQVQREYLEHIVRLNEYMISLVGSWADMERLNKGQVVLDIQSCNIGTFLSEQVTVNRGSHWPIVLADPLRLRQILTNCVDSLKNPEVRARTAGGMCIVTMHDRAPIKPSERASILEALHGDAPTVRLGLRISRLLAEAHGGSLQLDPHASDGTKLRLRLPLAQQMSLLGDILE